MNITIYHKINEGDLYPPCSVTMHLSDLVKQHFNDVPSSLEQAEEWLTAELQGDTSLSFPPAPKKIPVRMTPEAKYTAIKRDIIPVVLPLDSINRTPVERYYNAIIIWEGYRIVETLLRNAASREDDDLTRDDVKETLKQLQRVSGAAFEINDKKIHPALNIRYDEVPPEDEDAYDMVYRIYRFLWQYACKLYYEIGIMFDAVLKPEDVDPVRDFCNDVLVMFPKEYHLETYVDEMKHIHAAQKAIVEDEADTSHLALLYSCKHTSLSSLKPTISLLEDALFSKQIEADEISFKGLKADLTGRINALDNPREILQLIGDELMTIGELGLSKESHSSQVAQYRDYLEKQQELYEKNLGAMFSTLVPAGGKKVKTKPKQQGLTLPQMKKKVHETLSFMSGNTHAGAKIMSDADFKTMNDTVVDFVRTGQIPNNITRVTTTLSNEYVVYTFYLLYRQLKHFGRQNWIDLTQQLFSQLDTWGGDTIYKRFSHKPQYYYQDVGK